MAGRRSAGTGSRCPRTVGNNWTTRVGNTGNTITRYEHKGLSPGRHPALSGLRDQLGGHGSALERRECHNRRHRARRAPAPDRYCQRPIPDRSGLGRRRPTTAAPRSPATGSSSQATGRAGSRCAATTRGPRSRMSVWRPPQRATTGSPRPTSPARDRLRTSRPPQRTQRSRGRPPRCPPRLTARRRSTCPGRLRATTGCGADGVPHRVRVEQQRAVDQSRGQHQLHRDDAFRHRPRHRPPPATTASSRSTRWAAEEPPASSGPPPTPPSRTRPPACRRRRSVRRRSTSRGPPPGYDGGAPITSYKVEISADAGSTWGVLVPATGSTGTSYSHTGIEPGSTRHYRVAAINVAGTGLPSNVAHASTDDPVQRAGRVNAEVLPHAVAALTASTVSAISGRIEAVAAGVPYGRQATMGLLSSRVERGRHRRIRAGPRPGPGPAVRRGLFPVASRGSGVQQAAARDPEHRGMGQWRVSEPVAQPHRIGRLGREHDERARGHRRAAALGCPCGGRREPVGGRVRLHGRNGAQRGRRHLHERDDHRESLRRVVPRPGRRGRVGDRRLRLG